MAKQISRFTISLSVALAAIIGGCSNPESHPIIPPSEFRDGNPLDMSANFIPASGSPYVIEEDWVIEADRTVEIEAGTVIMIAGRNWIDINGKLIARGTDDAPIHFTSAHYEPEYGQWRGLKFDNPSDPSELEHCIFTYGAYFDTDTLTERGQDAQHYKGMLAIRNSSPVIKNCICYHNQNNAVYIEGENAAPTILYSIFTDNDASGIRADTTVNLDVLINNKSISFNCVADNSAPPFIMGFDSLIFGKYATVNNNIDSCDQFFNIDLPPLLGDPMAGWADESDFHLQSCSPCVDAGPFDPVVDSDPDGTIGDMGSIYYVRELAELRGRADGTLEAITYRLTCNLVVAQNQTLTIPAGCRIEATGDYEIRVLGQLSIQGGTGSDRVEICNCAVEGNDVWSGITFSDREGVAPSTLTNVDIVGFEEVQVLKPGTSFEGVRLEQGRESGVFVSTNSLDTATPVTFTNCSFMDCGEFAIRADSSAVEVRNSYVEGTKGRGIVLVRTHEAVTIQNTIVAACSTNALHLETESNPTVVNNVFANSGYYGVAAIDNCYPNFMNNIVTGNGRAGMYVSNVSAPALSYNNVYKNGMRLGSEELNYYEGGTGGSFLIPDAGSLIADPQFIDGFRLGSGSPCINAGNPEILDTDGSRSDMGAYGGPGGDGVGVPMRGGSMPARAAR